MAKLAHTGETVRLGTAGFLVVLSALIACGSGPDRQPVSRTALPSASASATPDSSASPRVNAHAQPSASARTSLVHKLDATGSETHLETKVPVPAGAKCQVQAVVTYSDGKRHTLHPNGERDPASGIERWDIPATPEPAQTVWSADCTAPVSSEPGGIWTGDVPPTTFGSPPSPSIAPVPNNVSSNSPRSTSTSPAPSP